MKIQYHGHACFSITCADGTVLVTDPFDPSVSFPPCAVRCDAALVSHDHFDHNYTGGLRGNFTTVSAAGETRVGGARIRAMESFHDDRRGALRGKNLLFRIEADGLSIAHLGDLGHMPSPAQEAFLAGLDLLMLPIGGNYTIDATAAEAILRRLKPRHAVAMHFRTEAYDINIDTCDAFAKDTGAAFMPNKIEITPEAALPEIMILQYKD